MRNFAICFVILCPAVFAENTEDKTVAQHTMEVIDGFCLQNQDNFKNIGPLALSVGGQPVDSAGDPVLREQGGEAFLVPYLGRKYLVSYANGGACSVAAQDSDLNNLKPKLKKSLELKEVHREESLTKISEWYSIQKQGTLNGSLVILTYAQSYKEVSISFMPASVVNELK